MPLPALEFTQEEIPSGDLILDTRVNPRDPSLSWARRQLDDGYNRALLGVFIISRRRLEGGAEELVLLDGANRKTLMEMAEDADYPVPSIVFDGLTLEQEAQVASEYNDRREWTGIRKFQALVTMGDPTARRIQEVLGKGNWRISTDTDNGVIRGVRPIERLLVTAGQWAAAELGAKKGTQAWHAAMESGRDDAFRVLEQAINVYNIAFPTQPSGYAPDIMHGLSLLLLKYGQEVDLERLTQRLVDNSRGQRAFRNDAKAARETYKLSMTDAYAFMAVVYYNVGYKTSSRGFLQPWQKTTR